MKPSTDMRVPYQFVKSLLPLIALIDFNGMYIHDTDFHVFLNNHASVVH